jgi:hypothetical protein
MAIGKPVIATAYSGNLGFTRVDNSYLVPATLTPVPPGNDPYLPPARWADPDLPSAVAAMRAVVDDPAEAARRGERARTTIAEEFSIDALAVALRRRLAEIAELPRPVVEAEEAQPVEATAPEAPGRRRFGRRRGRAMRG